MWWFDKDMNIVVFFRNVSVLILLSAAISACQFQPLHGNNSVTSEAGTQLSGVTVSQVNSRVGQQVRNHLLFLMNGGFAPLENTHEARIRVTFSNRLLASVEGARDSTSGVITVSVYYDLLDISSGKIINNGTRQAEASYDRTGQVFANTRAERDAENRAAKEAAESIRLAIAANLASS